ncbi:MAG: CHASE domain-containing protein [Alishewanella sp.]|nr:CHASE domain-containing protein [Alishewanella sp.]
MSITLSYKVHQANQSRIQTAVKASLQQKAQDILTRIQLYQYGLRGARGALITIDEEKMSRNLFHRYSQTRDVDSEFPGARGFGFIRRVPRQQEAAFLAAAQADGWPSFSIKELTPHIGERYVIQYIEPVERNLAAVGLDIASEHNRYQAALSSMQSGEVRLTGPITLVQASGQPQQSFLIMMPMYRGAVTPTTVAEREELAFGWSYAALLMSEVLADKSIDSQQVILHLTDITDPEKPDLFFKNTTHNQIGLYPIRETHQVYGRTWQFDYSVTPQFIAELRLPSPSQLGIIGSMLSFLLALLTGLININLTHKRLLQAEQAKLAAIVHSSADGIIGHTIDGNITSWNQGATAIFGFKADEAIGKTLSKLIVRPADIDADLAFFKRAAQGEYIPNVEVVRQHKNGKSIDVSITFSPVRSSEGRVIGVSKVVRDISKQKAAEAKIQQLNANLETQVEQRTADLAKINLLFKNVLSAASEFAIIATDTSGEIQLFNHGAERLLGYQASEVIGQTTPLLFHDQTEIASHATALSKIHNTHISGFQTIIYTSNLTGVDKGEWHYIRKDGQRFPITMVVTTMRNDQAQVVGYLCISTDITQQKQQQAALLSIQKQLLSKTEQLTLAYEVAQLGIWEWSISDDVLQWNDKMFQLYEQPITLREQGLNYAHWESRVHPEDRAFTLSSLHNAVAGIGEYTLTFRLILPSGKTRYIQAGAYVQRDEKGRAIRVIGVNSDITATHELEQYLRESKAAAEDANAAKSLFLANMSHEIRTPMNAILGMLQLMKTTELSMQQDDYTSNAQIAAESLLHLINDILDYSKIEAGKLELEQHPFNLDELMRELAVVLAHNLATKTVELLFDIDPELPQWIIGDKLRLQQILINLASNAIKFTHQGEVIIQLQQVHAQDRACRIRFSVIDTGIGISPAQQQRIFDGFTQAEASTTRQYGGSGLGLVISKNMVQMMGGELQLKSALGEGSHFWFDIDLALDTDRALAEATTFEKDTNILIIDDNPSALTLLSQAVSQHGAKVLTAASLIAAKAELTGCYAQQQSIQALLLDYPLPDLSELSTLKQLNTSTDHALPPIIMLVTAKGREALSTLPQDRQIPYAAMLTKPVTPKQLVELIASVLAGKQPALNTRVKPSKRTKQLKGLRLLLVEDNEINQFVAKELLQNEGAIVDIATGGLEGVNAVLQSSTPEQGYDAVLMDVQMPNIDGLEATRRIRADGRFSDLPIIAMTANVYAADQAACLQAGMNAHLTKPFDIDAVISTLLQYTGRSPAAANSNNLNKLPINRHKRIVMEQAINSAEADLPSQPRIIKTRANLLQRFADNEQFFQRVLQSFESNLAQQLIDLQRAITQQDWAQMLAIVHTLKGTSGTVGLTDLHQLLCQLEHNLKQASVHAEDVATFTMLTSELEQQIRTAAANELSIIHQLFAE